MADASMTQDAPTARLKVRYLEEIRPSMIERFGYSSVMQAPRIEKITLNMGVGMGKQDSKVLKAASDQLATIAGQRPNVRRARKSIAAFKLREGNPVGLSVTLRGDRSYEFLDRLITIAIPRIRDFRGLSARSFDGRGNYSMGVKEQIIFPEVDYDAIDQVRGLDITITTSAATDAEAYALLSAFGMPFSQQGRPAELGGDGGQGTENGEPPAAAADAAAPAAEPQSTPAEGDRRPADTGVEETQPAEEAEPGEAEPQPQQEPEPDEAAAEAPEAEPQAEAEAEQQPAVEPGGEVPSEPEGDGTVDGAAAEGAEAQTEEPAGEEEGGGPANSEEEESKS